MKAMTMRNGYEVINVMIHDDYRFTIESSNFSELISDDDRGFYEKSDIYDEYMDEKERRLERVW